MQRCVFVFGGRGRRGGNDPQIVSVPQATTAVVTSE